MPDSGLADAHTVDEAARRDLGRFLRTRRESLDPVRAGIVSTGRRRTPGLRREEVAQLAGIGTTWYTWLEQGRQVHASAQALEAIAGALHCTPAERHHLFGLAGLPYNPPSGCTSVPPPRVTPQVQQLLDRLDPLPALVQSARFDILAFNVAYQRLVDVDLAKLAETDRNCLYLAFTHPAWSECLPDRDMALQRMVAMFRAAMVAHRDDPAWQRLLGRLQEASPKFVELWERYEVHCAENQFKRFTNARVGELRLYQSNWWSAPRNGERLVVYQPADADSERALTWLMDH